MAGLTVDGLVVKTVNDIIEDIVDDINERLGNSVAANSDDTIIGRIIAIVAAHIGEVWELAEATYNSQDVDSNTGAAQDATAALTGTTRLAAAESTVTLTLTGDDATVVPILSRVSVVVTETEFETTAEATLASTDAWVNSTAYSLGDRVTNASRVYQCITAGTSAGSGGPTTTSADITDNTAHWRYLGEGDADIDVAAESADTGPIVGASGDITVIETPVSGWESVINVLDATLGRNEESHEDLRIRREDELTSAGNSPTDAIRADLLAVDDVTAVTIFYNDGDTTDGDGIPPHAVEALVTGGTDQDIWDTLLASVAAGIATYGAEVGTADDAKGTAQTVMFTRPDEIEIYCILTLTYDALLYPADGDTQIKTAIVTYGDAQLAGRDVTSSVISAQAFSVTGLLDVSLAYIGIAPAPSSEATIAISLRELAVFDTSRITINSSAAIP